MKVLVINSGSSSIKYQLIETKTEKVITKGIYEKIGIDSEFTYLLKNGEKKKINKPVKDHTEALQIILENLISKENEFINSLEEIEAIGHRVVHGGEEFTGSVLINKKVIESIEKFSELAPLHNPPNLLGIYSCLKILPNKKQVAVFDTAFHQTMPNVSYIYAIPYEYYVRNKIRRYGFHGTSHRYVSMKAAEYLGLKLDELNCITCHLGNGSSITAIKNGKSYDTSMGFTPLEGIVMGTRCGSIDPAIVFYIMDKEKLSRKQIDDILNKKSGLLGISGISNDMREIIKAAENGNERAKLAIDIMIQSVKKYIGAYIAELGIVHSIIFTAGIGENEPNIRKKILQGLEFFGVIIDDEKNFKTKGVYGLISKPESKIKVLVVPTNEELMIAIETELVVSQS